MDTSDDEEELMELETESLFASAQGVWEVIEWAFYKGTGGWVDILNHIVRVLRNDWDECRASKLSLWGSRLTILRMGLGGR